ncbi:MAG: helicase-related protein, partial [Geminicoccales bacterium]
MTAVLGPTNTGKTYLAIERMLGYRTGMIGFPLRLLARENYDRVVAVKGRGRVALVTGEEKILPANPAYFLCTVESMPINRPVEFLAIDEIQLCADPDRGHVFTDRLLHARGSEETMFLGSDTVRPLLRKLVPEAEYISRPRFSKLTYIGPKKVTRLPPRSAVVAFSAADVYAIAELVRQQRGGTAVVLGALSPRTRNAQVALFEGGEVDYLVATDAIGMGLNLNLDHVAFAKLGKFDGRLPRRLSAAEVAQIAGRAGRHMSDGTFGVTAEQRPMEPGLVEAVEAHRFDPLHALCWRSRDLDFRSIQLLLKALERRPPVPQLVRVRNADDQLALSALARDPEVERHATNPAAVRLLWEVCQVPDFRKILSDQHVRLLGQVYRHLVSGEGWLAEDWVARHLAHIDRTDGDIDALTARIAHVRTWTYIAHRGDWLADSVHWQERARAIEDRLSDALHDRLTQRFVDRRAAFLVRRLK